MSILTYFKRKKTASIAKDRLHIIIAQERQKETTPNYLPLLREEILAVVAKYANVNLDEVKVDLHHNNHNSILELNVILPEITEMQ